jgi:hypothetical protein
MTPFLVSQKSRHDPFFERRDKSRLYRAKNKISMLNKIYLHKDEKRQLLAGHLWCYSNKIDTQKSPLQKYQPG